MHHDTAVRLISNTFNQRFEEQRFAVLVGNLLNEVDAGKAFESRHGPYVSQAFREHIRQYKRPFVYTDPEGERLDVLVVRLQRASALDRARTMQRNFIAWYLKQSHDQPVEAALVAFYHDDVDDWRFSLVRLEYGFGDEGLTEKLTPARRYSFLVGPNEPTHTAEQQLLPLLQEERRNPTIDEIGAAFQVEVVSRQFFEAYRELFLRLVEALEALLAGDGQLRADFARAEVDLPGFAKKLLGQIVFLYFVQKKGWLGVAPGGRWGEGPRDFLRRLFEKRAGVAYDNFYNDVLEPLFYRALAVRRPDDLFSIGGYTCQIPFLNGGLFEPMGNYDWQNTRLLLPNRLFSGRQGRGDDGGDGILDVFDRTNFTVREEEPLEKEVAVDPEMLGKVFENLLEVQDRKSKGAFYTPREIVHYMCQESLINYLDTAVNGSQPPGDSEPGSGIPRDDLAALVRRGALALQQDAAKEAGLKTGEYVLPESVRENAVLLDAALAAIKLCDPAIGSGAFPVGMLHEIVQARLALATYIEGEAPTPYALKRHAIQESIYGVDIDAGAVEIAKLRLWLSLVVDEESYDDIQPLPNLDYKIVQGNSLLGAQMNRDLFTNQWFVELEGLKRRYFDETQRHEKLKLRAQIEFVLERLAGTKDAFDFDIYFHEVFAEKDGFDVVLGNPPYVRMELFKEMKPALQKAYPQVYSGRADLYVYFYKRGLEILQEGGTLAFISSNKFMRAKYGEKLRKLFVDKTTIHAVIDFGDLPVFDATAYPSIVMLRQQKPEEETKTATLTVNSIEVLQRLPREVDEMAWKAPQRTLRPAGWALVHPEIQALMQKLRRQGTPLEEYVGSQFYRGIVSGYNEAFVINETVRRKLIASDSRSAELIKPWLRGRDVDRWSVNHPGLYVIFMSRGVAISRYPAVEEHLRQFKDRLENRATSHLHPWYEMQQPQMGCYFEFEKFKIVYPDIAKRPSFAYDESGAYITNTLYVIPTTEKYLLGLLNSNVVHFFYSQISAQVRGDYLRFIAQYVSQIPIPTVNEPQRAAIEEVVRCLLDAGGRGERVEEWERTLNEIMYQLYDLTPSEIRLIETETS